MTSSVKYGKKAIIFGKKYLVEELSFIDSQNTYLKMLNQSGLYSNEYGTRRSVSNFCSNLINWWDPVCLGRNTIEKTVETKKVNDNLSLNVSTPNTAEFGNYYKIAVLDHVCVPKFWRTWRGQIPKSLYQTSHFLSRGFQVFQTIDLEFLFK